MLQEFDGAARILNLEPGIWKILTHAKRQITVSCPIQMDNGEIEVFTGYRVQYNITLGPAKGGIRYHPGVTLDEVTALGRVDDLEVRCRPTSPSAAAKGGVICDPTKMSRREIEALTRRYKSPRSSTPSGPRRMSRRPTSTPTRRSWAVGHGYLLDARRPPRRPPWSPASRSRWAGSLGRREATGRGVMIAARESAKHVRTEHQGREGRGAGVRQRRIDLGGAAGAGSSVRRSSPSPTGRAASSIRRGSTSPGLLEQCQTAENRRRLSGRRNRWRRRTCSTSTSTS